MTTLDGGPHTPGLTPRQEQILVLIGEGLTNREIGERLGVAEKTIKNCVTGLLASLNLKRRSQAAAYAAVRRATTERGHADLGTGDRSGVAGALPR
jgi:two-component system, NarL family, response regulator DevR